MLTFDHHWHFVEVREGPEVGDIALGTGAGGSSELGMIAILPVRVRQGGGEVVEAGVGVREVGSLDGLVPGRRRGRGPPRR